MCPTPQTSVSNVSCRLAHYFYTEISTVSHSVLLVALDAPRSGTTVNEHIDLSHAAIPGSTDETTIRPVLNPGLAPEASFLQTDRWQRTTRCFELYSDGVIAITDKPSGQTVLLACEFIAGPLKKQWHIPCVCLATLTLALCALWLLVTLQQPLVICLLAAAITMIFAALSLIRTTLRYSLISVGGKITLAELSSPIYQRASLHGFANRLQAVIARQQQNNRQLPLPALVAEHRRLVIEHLITAADYDRAKNHLFRQQ